MTGLLRAWLVLVAASAMTTLVAVLHLEGGWVVAALLALALVKSRVILSDYLHLARVAPLRRGVMAVFLVWAGVALALALAAG